MKRKRSPATNDERSKRNGGPEKKHDDDDNAENSCCERREIPQHQRTSQTSLGRMCGAPTTGFFPISGPKAAHRNLSQRWDHFYGILQEFHRRHGHSNVPQRYPEDRALGSWVGRQRSVRGRQSLSAQQVQRLNDLDFTWEIQSERFDRIWLEKFQLLKEYRDLHGHCNVPQYEKFRGCQLGFWVSNLRMLRKRGTLRHDRFELLQSLKFVWVSREGSLWSDHRDTDRIDTLWESMYQQLVDFYKDYGHVVVPNLFINGRNWPLGRWVRAQRTNNTQNTLLPERRELLDDLGFVWRVPKHSEGQEADLRHWKCIFNRLVTYWEEHGDCHVPRSYTSDPELGRWAHEQRTLLSAGTGTMHAFKIDRMDAIGFLVTAERYQECWEQQFANLVEYKNTHGSLTINHIDAGGLLKWTASQRWLERNGILSAERKRKLIAIGFQWDRHRKPKLTPNPDPSERRDFSSVSRTDDDSCSSEEQYGSEDEGTECRESNFSIASEEDARDESSGDESSVSAKSERGRARVECSGVYACGTRVKKFFPGYGWFSGEIAAFQGLYLIQYEDGDEEEILFDDPALNDMVSDSPSVPETQMGPPFRLGTRVKKYFPGHGWFGGKIAAFDGVYLVRYEDNDEEEYNYDCPNLRTIVLQESASDVPGIGIHE